MQKLILTLIIALTAVFAGCSKSPSIALPCTRYTDLSETLYRIETGLLNRDGFFPTHSSEFAYSNGLAQRSEILPVSGKTILEQGLWVGFGKPSEFICSRESYLIHGVPYLVVNPNH